MDMGKRGGGGEMYGDSHTETYITVCKIDSQGECAVCLGELKQGSVSAWRGGMGSRFKREGTYGWIILTHTEDRKQQNSVKQLSFD